jgi:ABC-type transport system substrate-binding protein
MQNRFGLKDFVIILGLVVLVVSVWLSMAQDDRRWNETQRVEDKLADLERQLSRIEAGLEGGVRVAGPAAGSVDGSGPERDTGWARPGEPIAFQEPWDYATDPRGAAGFTIGGVFTECFESQPAKLTPFIQTDVYGRRVLDLVSETLGAYDPETLELRGLLADAWQVDPAGRWLRVHINPRARFSDGEPVTAEDVRWTFHDFVMNMEIEAERSRSIIGDVIARVEVIDEKTVEFTFHDAFFSNMDSALVMNILPRHIFERLTPAQINQGTGLLFGSGPFKLKTFDVDRQWAPPDTVVLVRNEQYWGPKPPLEEVRFMAINDEQSRLIAYKSDEATMITPSAPQFVSAMEDAGWVAGNHNLDWINMRSGRSGIIWNCGPRQGKLTPFHDRRVRVAMTHLLDREKMIRDLWQGVGQVCSGFFNPGTLGFEPGREPWPYDPAEGRRLLAEAGWTDTDNDRVLEDAEGNEFVFELTYFGGGEIAERIALFIKDACAAAGIRCTLRQMDWSVGDPVRNQRDFDAMLMGWGANAPESDPKQIFHSDAIKDQGDNFAQWSNADADRSIDLARKELDPVKRSALWWEFERAMHQDQPYTWVRVTPWLRFVKQDVGNVHTYPRGLEPWEFFRGGASAPTPMN